MGRMTNWLLFQDQRGSNEFEFAKSKEKGSHSWIENREQFSHCLNESILREKRAKRGRAEKRRRNETRNLSQCL